MKYLIFLFVLGVQTFGRAQEPAVISGRLTDHMLGSMGEGDITVECYSPYFGNIHNENIPTKIAVDTLTGTFTWKIQLQEPMFVLVGVMGQKVSVYLDAGWRISVILETNRYGKLFAEFQGDGKTENEAFRDAVWSQHFRLIDRHFDEHLDSMPLPQLIAGYRELLVQNAKPIDSLYVNGLVDGRFHELGKKGIEAVNVFLATGRLVSLSHMTKDSLRKERISAVLKEASSWFDLRDNDWLKVPEWPVFFTAHAMMLDISTLNAKEVYTPWKITDCHLYLPEPARESSLYSLLVTEIQRKPGEIEFEEAYAFFREQYPDSRYTAIVEDLLKKEAMKKQWVVRYEGNLEPSNDSSRSLVVDFSNTGDTLEVKELLLADFGELLEAVQENTPVYIDFWATWCFPCKQEFPHSVARHADMEEAGVLPIYVSIDDPANYTAWIRSIAEYKLEGRHVLASKALYDRLREEIELGGIPRYMLVDNNGKIVDPDATRPSDVEGIRKALGELNKDYK